MASVTWARLERPLGRLRTWRRLTAVLSWLGRSAIVIGRGFVSVERNEQVGFLVYTTLLSLVPTLAVAFAIYASFGGGIEQMKQQALALLPTSLYPSQVQVIGAHLDEILIRMRTAPLGGFGIVGLLLAVTLLIWEIEGTLNRIWSVRTQRRWSQRLPLYWSVATLAPILMVISTTLLSRVPHIAKPAPFLVGWLVFAAIYKILPNGSVGTIHAVLGGLVASVLFHLCARGLSFYTSYVVDYSRLYGSLSAIPVFLLWLFLEWHVILAGAQVAYASQNPKRYKMSRSRSVAAPLRELLEIATRLVNGEAPTHDDLARDLGLSCESVDTLMQPLVDSGLVTVTAQGEQRTYALARPAEEITLTQFCEAGLGIEKPSASGPSLSVLGR